MVARNTEQTHAAYGGMIAGIVGGVAIAVFMLVMAYSRGGDLWMVFKGAGYPFLGDRALQPGFDALAIAVGTLSHFAVSITWGVLFGLLFFGLSSAATLVAGLLWGVVVWLGMFYVILPLIGAGFMARGMPVSLAVTEHLMFGIAMGVGFLPFQRMRTLTDVAAARSP